MLKYNERTELNYEMKQLFKIQNKDKKKCKTYININKILSNKKHDDVGSIPSHLNN